MRQGICCVDMIRNLGNRPFVIKSFCGGSRGAVFSKSAPWPSETKKGESNGYIKKLAMAGAG
jgi:hypothetical protein